MLNLSFMLYFMIIMGLLSIASKRKHLLAILLSLEMMILSIFFLVVLFTNIMSMDFMFSITFLTLAVCEGSLGLSILVSMVRKFGNDSIQSLNLN